MRLIKPSYAIEAIDGGEILKRIEEAGRTCYKSEDKITPESGAEFIAMIIRRGHESVLEHEKMTVRFICDRGVSHELVRHRLASFSQESTRYCNYSTSKHGNNITFIIPPWVNLQECRARRKDDLNGQEFAHLNVGEFFWAEACLSAERDYMILVDQGWKPEQARSVLPNSLKTEIVVKANLRQWREMFRQRTAKAAHPQMRELMRPLLNDCKVLLPVIFEDISYE